MKWKSKAILLCSLVLLAFSTVACEKKGDAEKVGEKIDDAIEKAKKKITDATK